MNKSNNENYSYGSKKKYATEYRTVQKPKINNEEEKRSIELNC
jgi:hypothetical protein